MTRIFWKVHPDVLSILIGINDVGSRYVKNDPRSPERFEREYGHKGIQYRLENPDGNPLPADATYTVRAWVKVTDDKTHQMGIQTMLRGGQPGGGVNAAYKTVAAASGWVQLETTVMPEILAAHPGTKQLDFVIGNQNTTASAGRYLVDDVEFIYSRALYPLTVEGGAGSGEYPTGMQVAITAQTPEGKMFENWTLNGVQAADPTMPVLVFTMPVAPVTAVANYKNLPVPTASPVPTDNSNQLPATGDMSGLSIIYVYFASSLVGTAVLYRRRRTGR